MGAQSRNKAKSPLLFYFPVLPAAWDLLLPPPSYICFGTIERKQWVVLSIQVCRPRSRLNLESLHTQRLNPTISLLNQILYRKGTQGYCTLTDAIPVGTKCTTYTVYL